MLFVQAPRGSTGIHYRYTRVAPSKVQQEDGQKTRVGDELDLWRCNRSTCTLFIMGRPKHDTHTDNDNDDVEDGMKRDKVNPCNNDDQSRDVSQRRPSSKHGSRRSCRREKQKRRSHEDSDESSSSSSLPSSLSSLPDKKRRRKDKKHKRKKDKKKEKKRSKRDKVSSRRRLGLTDESHNDAPDRQLPVQRNYALASALVDLLDDYPSFVEDLPILFIRLGSGTTFDLSHMTDVSATRRLEQVLTCLEPFGVVKDTNDVWMWQGPALGGKNDLFLLKLVRAMLDECGVTLQAVENVEQSSKDLASATLSVAKAPVGESQPARSSNILVDETLERVTINLLEQFLPENRNFNKELIILCQSILQGESIALDGLDDSRLRDALEDLFVQSGLDKSEMEDDDIDHDARDVSTDMANERMDGTTAVLGYCLPQGDASVARAKIEQVIAACEKGGQNTLVPTSSIKGPIRRPHRFDDESNTESSDEEGPNPASIGLIGQSKYSAHDIHQMALTRSRQMAMAKEGLDVTTSMAVEGHVREEWMIVPGKYDFLSQIKAGNPMRSRGFETRSKAEPVDEAAAIMDPNVQQEINSIKDAYEKSRGPSLLERHRLKKTQLALQKSAEQSDSWNWKRDKDLDSGRKVDKRALAMILGGAGADLKMKFHGGQS